MSVTYYKGRNGLEYGTPQDAEIYGEGLVGKRTVSDPVFEPCTIDDINGVEKEESDLLSLAKEKGIKGAHLMKEETLKEKLGIN